MLTTFSPYGVNATVNVAVGAASTQLNLPVIPPGSAVRLVNSGTTLVFLEFGTQAAPPVAAVATSIPMLPNTSERLMAPTGGALCITVIAPGAGTNTLYATVGRDEKN